VRRFPAAVPATGYGRLMHARLRIRALGAAVAAAAFAVAASGAGPAAGQSATTPLEITGRGVGAIELGATFRELREAGLVGRLREGCPLGGPGSRAARLRRPLEGGVDFTRRGTARVRAITIRGGAAEARGVAIGDTRRELRRAFPGVRFDRSTEEVFGITLATVPRRAGGRIQFGVGVGDRRVQLIGVPFIPFCE
jgi:hypothetical protein